MVSCTICGEDVRCLTIVDDNQEICYKCLNANAHKDKGDILEGIL